MATCHYDFSGKIAIVTGAGSGMGAETARRLSAAGARVALVDVNLEAAEAVASELSGAIAIRADVSVEADVQAYVERTVRELGRVDLFHNNAGLLGRPGPLLDATVADFDFIIGVNLRGAFLGLREVGKAMKAQGSGGSIVTTASIAGLRGVAGCPIYSAAKFGVLGLIRSASKELGGFGVRVNAICPGPTFTSFAQMSDAAVSNYKSLVPLGRLAESDDMAAAVLWLLSDGARFINGAVLPVDGGQTA